MSQTFVLNQQKNFKFKSAQIKNLKNKYFFFINFMYYLFTQYLYQKAKHYFKKQLV